MRQEICGSARTPCHHCEADQEIEQIRYFQARNPPQEIGFQRHAGRCQLKMPCSKRQPQNEAADYIKEVDSAIAMFDEALDRICAGRGPLMRHKAVKVIKNDRCNGHEA